jgi:hypothetical protein
VGDAQGADRVGDGDVSELGWVWEGEGGADEEGMGLGEVDTLGGGICVGTKGCGEGSDGGRLEVRQVDLGVVSVVRRDKADALDSDAQSRLGTQEGGEGLGEEEVQAGRERAALAHPCLPQEGGGGYTIDNSTRPSV